MNPLWLLGALVTCVLFGVMIGALQHRRHSLAAQRRPVDMLAIRGQITVYGMRDGLEFGRRPAYPMEYLALHLREAQGRWRELRRAAARLSAATLAERPEP